MYKSKTHYFYFFNLKLKELKTYTVDWFIFYEYHFLGIKNVTMISNAQRNNIDKYGTITDYLQAPQTTWK